MTSKRRPYKTYPKEFKLEALRLMETSDKPASEVAMQLGIRRNQLYKWKEQMSKKGDVASSVPVSTPDGPPKNGVVMFSQCDIAQDGDWNKAVAGHKQFSGAMREMGAKSSNWLFFPMLGGSAEQAFDYWSVTTLSSWTDYFAAYEIYVNGGGWQKQMEALDGAASCGTGTASVWNVTLVREGAR